MIERLYPGVYLEEVAFDAKPIEGVPTSTGPASASAVARVGVLRAGDPAPDWTDGHTHDPGITLVELFAFLNESLLYRVDLSQVESRYIGETEKNLSGSFGDAPSSDAVLLYDESDSLFGKRP